MAISINQSTLVQGNVSKKDYLSEQRFLRVTRVKRLYGQRRLENIAYDHFSSRVTRHKDVQNANLKTLCLHFPLSSQPFVAMGIAFLCNTSLLELP